MRKPSLLFPTAQHTGLRAKERRCGGEDRPWRSSLSAFAFLNEDFIPLRHEKAERHRFCCERLEKQIGSLLYVISESIPS